MSASTTQTHTQTTDTCLFRIFHPCFISLLLVECECCVYISSRTHTNTDARFSSSFSPTNRIFIILPNHPEKVVQSRTKKSNEKSEEKIWFSQNREKRLNRITTNDEEQRPTKKNRERKKISEKFVDFFFIDAKKKHQPKSAVLNSFGMCLVVYVTLPYLTV